MRTGRVTRASNFNFNKMVNVPDEVVAFFERLKKEYKSNSFIIEVDPDTYEEGTEASIEFMIYDDYVE